MSAQSPSDRSFPCAGLTKTGPHWPIRIAVRGSRFTPNCAAVARRQGRQVAPPPHHHRGPRNAREDGPRTPRRGRPSVPTRRDNPTSTGAGRARTGRRRRRAGTPARRISPPSGSPPGSRSPRRAGSCRSGRTRSRFACSSCLNRTRLAQCSPVATPIGATARAIAAWPSTSSGLVGSSIHSRSNRASACTLRIASPTSQRWLASIISLRSGPIASRTSPTRRASSAGSAPTLTLKCVNPSAIGLATQPAHLLVRVSHPPGGRRVGGVALAPQDRLTLAVRRLLPFEDLDRLVGRERVGDVLEVDAADDLPRRHVGQQLPHRLAGALGLRDPTSR